MRGILETKKGLTTEIKKYYGEESCQSGQMGFPAKECVVKGTRGRIPHSPPFEN